MQLNAGFVSAALQLFVAFIGGWLAAFLGEKFAAPSNRSAWRNLSALLIHLGIYTLVFFFLVGVTRRAYFSAGIALAMVFTVFIVNNAKYKALREPFVFTDFSLFTQALKHPRLYLPFLNPVAAILGPVAIIAVVYLGLVLDPPLTDWVSVPVLVALLVTGGVAGAALVCIGTRHAAAPSFKIIDDVDRWGLLPSLWMYRRAEAQAPLIAPETHLPRVRVPRIGAAASDALPHFVLVQSESFFDARRLLPSIRRDILENFDRAVAAATDTGRMHVPAWGANTMRSEFAVLTGISAEQLGVHGFNPYRKFARQPLHSLASRLGCAGFDTVCVHPHPASFFGRNKVFPALGFKRFLDIAAFPSAEKFGPYVSDSAVTDKIFEVLAAACRPTFVFVITMENHGPLHLEKVPDAALSEFYTAPPAAELRDLSVYLRHLRNADRMIGALTQRLAADYPASTLVFYGDHVPSMPDVYRTLDFHDGRSDYFIWSPKSERPTAQNRELYAEELAERGLLAAGLIRPRPENVGRTPSNR